MKNLNLNIPTNAKDLTLIRFVGLIQQLELYTNLLKEHINVELSKTLYGVHIGPTPPEDPVANQLWWDTNEED